MLHRMVVLAGLFYALCAWAVDPSTNLQTYYAAADGKATDANDALRKQLCTIISTGYTAIAYDNLKNSMYAASSNPTDFYIGSSMTMEDIYSSKTYIVGDAGSSATECGTGWNKEHTVPQSWFGKATPMVSDAHHIFPTDIKMNSTRSNYPYGENETAKTCSQYGYGHLGNSTFAGYSGKVFDPGSKEECGGKCYRGDLARAYFYMVTRYRTTNFTQDTENNGKVSFTYTDGVADLTDYMKNLMLKWHREDPVSEKELLRNNAIYAHQKNRNPFVDYPCLAEYIWGEHKGEVVDLSALVSGYAGVGTDCCGSGGSGGGGGDPTPTPTPEEYYAPVEGLQDSVLKSRLAELTWENYTKRYSYGSGKNNTWEAFWYTDRDESDNSVIDRYSNNKRYFNPDNTTASVADCDIEHMFPNSWFGGESGNKHAYCDLHHLVPSDYSANRSKSNRGPGVPTDTTFNNGVWVNGNDTNRGNLSVFCPPDRYKGDFARAFFYIATTYGDTAVWQTNDAVPHMTNDDWHEFLPETRELLLQWHREDPVSDEERTRNNTVYGLQGNRNPFIDYPCLAEYIWGTLQGEVFALNCSATPLPKYAITWSIKGETRSDQIKQGTKPTPPSVTNCSTSRVFVGWTTSSKVTSKPAVLYAGSEIPAATAAATYYAVFADKETTASGTPSVTGFAFNSKGYTNGHEISTVTQDDVTISFDKGSNANTPKYYTDGSSIRCYGGNTITVTATGITKIVFTFGTGEKTNTISVTPGTYNADTKTWTGSADKVVFTIDGSTGHRRIQQMDVTSGSGSSTTYSNYGLECETCTPTAPEFEIGEATMSLNKGDQREIWYIYEPYDTPGTITYESDHPEIASVDEDRQVRALSAGTARITVHLSATECEKAADFYCNVTVHDFHTLEATNITANSFTANWTSDKTDSYNLDVYYSKIIESSELKNDTLYLKDFSTDIDGWTINTISGYENVWTYSSSYNCLYGTSYVNKTRYAAESRIVSPAIDLTQALSAELSLFHAFKYSTTIALQVSTDDGASWTNVSASPWTTFSSWDFAYATADLSDYIGQTIRVAFYYEGLSTACPTWEIQKLCITGTVNHTTYTPQTVHVDSYPKQVTGTNHTVTGLERASTYYYTVQPLNSEVSDPVEVTTEAGCQATITILSNDESMGTVEFVEE